jgi:hypothetical protein
MKKIGNILLFILGVLIAEIPFFHLIGYFMLSVVQSTNTCVFDTIIFLLGFIISFKALNDLGKLKHKKIIL